MAASPSMPAQRTVRRAQTRHREQALLRSARAIVRAHGFLGMRISEVARAAGVSVGTLYTHFEGREDLILALAGEASLGRLAGFKAVFADPSLGPAERLVVAVCIDFLFSVDHPELFAAEQLSATLSVWDGGSERRAHELSTYHAEIVRHMVAAARDAIDQGEFEPWADRNQQAASIDRGIWTLMAGSSHVQATVAHVRDDYEHAVERVLPASLRDNITALFRGYGWNATQPAQDVERLADLALELPTERTGDDAPLPN